MTLLEVLVALVIVGTSAAGFLELFQVSTRAARAAREWTEAVTLAATTMEETKLSASVPMDGAMVRDGFVREVLVTARADGLQEVLVSVRLPGGGVYELRRLAEAR